jgi:hypothetical protein
MAPSEAFSRSLREKVWMRVFFFLQQEQQKEKKKTLSLTSPKKWERGKKKSPRGYPLPRRPAAR